MCLRAISAISWNTCKMQIVFAGILSLTDCTDVCGTFIGVASKSAFGGKADIA